MDRRWHTKGVIILLLLLLKLLLLKWVLLILLVGWHLVRHSLRGIGLEGLVLLLILYLLHIILKREILTIHWLLHRLRYPLLSHLNNVIVVGRVSLIDLAVLIKCYHLFG